MKTSCRIFISCSTKEFGALRKELRDYLARANCDVKVQEDFSQSPDDTLQKLDDYIRNCDAVLHLVGSVTGAFASERSVFSYLKDIPNFLSRELDLQKSLKNNSGYYSELSFTQWEALIAVHHKINLFVYEKENASFDPGQILHRNRLRLVGRYPESFKDDKNLVGKLIGDLRNILPDFKGYSDILPLHKKIPAQPRTEKVDQDDEFGKQNNSEGGTLDLWSEDSPQDAKRFFSLIRFSVLWALLDQLPNGGWGHSLASWMRNNCDGIQMKLNPNIEVEGGIESTCLAYHFLAVAGVPTGSWEGQVLSYLHNRHDKSSGGYGSLSEVTRDGTFRIQHHARHTAWTILAFLDMNERQPGKLNNEINKAVCALFSDVAQNQANIDLNPGVLYALQVRIAGATIKNSIYSSYVPTESARQAAIAWFDNHAETQANRASALNSSEFGLNPLKPEAAAPFPNDPSELGELIYPYGGFARMQTYTHLVAALLVSKEADANFRNRIANGLRSITQWYLDDTIDIEYENPTQRPRLVDLRYPTRGIRPYPSCPHPDLSSTALMLAVLSLPGQCSMLFNGQALNFDKPKIKRMLLWDLINVFDRELLNPNIVSFSTATALAAVITVNAKVKDVNGEHSIKPEIYKPLLRAVESFRSRSAVTIGEGSIGALINDHIFFVDGKEKMPSNVFSISLVSHLSKLSRNSFSKTKAGTALNVHNYADVTAAAYTSCTGQFDHLVKSILNSDAKTRTPIVDRINKIIRKTFPDIKVPRVLDVGCGPGVYMVDFLKVGVDAYGVDASRGMIDKALEVPSLENRMLLGDYRHQETWIKLNNWMPFHGICCIASLHHINKTDAKVVLNKMYESLFPGGAIFISLQIDRVRGHDPDGRFIEQYRENEVGEMLKQAGFDSLDLSEPIFRLEAGCNTFCRQMTFKFQQVLAQKPI